MVLLSLPHQNELTAWLKYYWHMELTRLIIKRKHFWEASPVAIQMLSMRSQTQRLVFQLDRDTDLLRCRWTVFYILKDDKNLPKQKWTWYIVWWLHYVCTLQSAFTSPKVVTTPVSLESCRGGNVAATFLEFLGTDHKMPWNPDFQVSEGTQREANFSQLCSPMGEQCSANPASCSYSKWDQERQKPSEPWEIISH